MGTWGVKIFQSDDACDVRDTYREKLIVGVPDEDAEHAVIREFSMDLCPDCWLPLAVTEWKVGRLSEHTKQMALQQIEIELECLADLWKPDQVLKRRKELLSVRETLQSNMPARKKLRMPSWSWKCPWPVGSVLQYKVLYPKENNPICGQYVMLLVVHISETKPDKIPCEVIAVALYNWHSDSAPSVSTLAGQKIPLVNFRAKDGSTRPYHCILPAPMIQESEIKCISTSPLSEMPQEPATVYCPANSTFDNLISRTLGSCD